jgi:hypothetical protein
MTTEELQHVLTRMGCARVGSGYWAPCPLCQEGEEEPERFKLGVKAGDRRPIIANCVRCGVSHPQNEAQRQAKTEWWKKLWSELGIDIALVSGQMSSEEIDELWSCVRIGGDLPPKEVVPCLPDAGLHAAYSALLSKCELNDRHRRWLQKKGLDPAVCFNIGYRSAPTPQQAREWGATDFQAGVPGLSRAGWLTRENSILMPCRDRGHLIRSVKMRLFGEQKSRMRTLSRGGSKADRIVHWPVGVTIEQGLPLFVVESERAADCLHQRLGANVIALSGVSFWNRAIPLGQEARWVVIALDRDDAGRKHTGLLGRRLTELGARVQVCEWDGAKGPDDALVADVPLTHREWAEAEASYRDETQVQAQTSNPSTQLESARFVKGKWVKDHEILDYIRHFGGTIPRSEINAYQITIEHLIRTHKIKMWKNSQGQLLQVVDS